MATEEEKALDRSKQAQNLRERRALNDAYAVLEGQKLTQSWAAFTFEDAVDLQIEEIEGATVGKRPNQLDRVDRIEKMTLDAIAQIRNIPPEDFIDPDPDEDVNTEE